MSWMVIDVDCRCDRCRAVTNDLFSIRFFWVMLREWLPRQALASLPVRLSLQLRLSHRVSPVLVARRTVWLMVSDLSWWRCACCYRWKRLSCCRWWLVAYAGQLHKYPPIRRVSVFDFKLRIQVEFSWAVLVHNVIWNCRRVERHRFSRHLRAIGTINTLVLSTAMERVPLNDRCWNFCKRVRPRLVEAKWSRLLSVRRRNSKGWGHCPLRSDQGWRWRRLLRRWQHH